MPPDPRGAPLSLFELLRFAVGLVFLTGGAEALVRGAGRLARGLGVSSVVVGLTVVSLGTSAPEMAVSVDAALAGAPLVAVGNVVGSNIFNVLGILGLSAVVLPLAITSRLVRLDVPVMIGASLLLMVLALDGRIARTEGAVLLGLGAAYLTLLLVRRPSDEPPSSPGSADAEPTPAADEAKGTSGSADDAEEAGGGILRGRSGDLLLVAAGLGFLVLGSHWVVGASVTFARAVGVSELVIGLTLVAGGTSLPELATSVVAALRGERDLAVGNVVGSNVSNVFLVLGPAALVAPTGIDLPAEAVRFDLPVMLAVAAAALPIFFTGYRISRWEGALFVGYYLAYLLFLFFELRDPASADLLRTAIVFFVAPLTGLTLAILALRQLRTGGGG